MCGSKTLPQYYRTFSDYFISEQKFSIFVHLEDFTFSTREFRLFIIKTIKIVEDIWKQDKKHPFNHFYSQCIVLIIFLGRQFSKVHFSQEVNFWGHFSWDKFSRIIMNTKCNTDTRSFWKKKLTLITSLQNNELPESTIPMQL